MNNREDGASFFGKVTASTTHELQNVLAIIKENAGLMEDFIQMHADSSPDLLEKFTRCLGKIKEQSYRGVDLTSGLNKFAHTTDKILASVNLYEISKRLIFLTKRVFSQKGIQIVLIDCKNAPSFETDPVLFQKNLWDCLECLVEIPGVTSDIRVTIINADGEKGIDVCFEDSALDKESFSRELQGSVKWAGVQAGCQEINMLPSAILQDSMGIRILAKRPIPA
jgi:hypothetical protein